MPPTPTSLIQHSQSTAPGRFSSSSWCALVISCVFFQVPPIFSLTGPGITLPRLSWTGPLLFTGFLASWKPGQILGEGLACVSQGSKVCYLAIRGHSRPLKEEAPFQQVQRFGGIFRFGVLACISSPPCQPGPRCGRQAAFTRLLEQSTVHPAAHQQ